MRLTSDDIAAYAHWSRDRNPLHTDPAFAAGTFFGASIAHGMLSVSHALAVSPPANRTRQYDIEFRGAVEPDVDYALVRSDSGLAAVGKRETALRITCEEHADPAKASRLGRQADWATTVASPAVRDSAADRSLVDIGGIRELRGMYRTLGDPPPALADHKLSVFHAEVFALCSYVVGMEVPGLRSLFTRAAIALADVDLPAGTEFAYRVVVRRLDEQFRILDTQVEVAQPNGMIVATCDLRSYVRFTPVVTDLALLRANVSVGQSGLLEGRVALVCGGSRGLGADVVAALAMAGARVFALYRQDAAGAARLQERLAEAGRPVEVIQGDLSDGAWCATVVERISASAGRLDVLVLNACAPPRLAEISVDASAAFHDYLAANLSLVEAPLAASLGALRAARGTVVYVSSSVVENPQPRYGPYVALKHAGEGLIATALREAPQVSAIVLRPGQLQTSWKDTPTGVLGTIATDRVAVELVRQLAGTISSGETVVVADFPDLQTVEGPREAGVTDGPLLAIAVTASFTADPLEKGVAFWGCELGVRPSLTFAPYSQVLQTLFDPSSNLSTNAQGLNVVLLRVQDWLRELPSEQRDDEAFVRTHVEATTRDLVEAMRAHRARARAATLLLLCPSSAAVGSTAVGALLRSAEEGVQTQLSGVPGLDVLRAADLHERYAVDPDVVDDPLRDKIGHIPYADAYFHVLATLVMRQAWRRLVPTRKVVVVDCDNTLWRGVVGEVGAEGVEFDAGHLALHDTLTTLSASGVLVCLCSKNEEDDVWRVFDTRPEMRLRREHVVAAMINWQRKSENIRHLASTLNLGLDSFVFLDDNHVECAEVRAGCPEVLTLEWPHDPDAARRLLEHAWELDVTSATAEDRKRTQMYREEFGRQALRQGASNFRDFLASLDLVVDVSPLSEADVTRAAQLTLRTNQFNFTTIRRDESELRALQQSGRHELRTVRVRDRFGDYGLVGLLIAERQADALVTDTFLMSCRVLGRGAEHRMAAELGRMALAHGLDTVHLHVEPTRRNAPAQKFLASLDGDGHAQSIDLAAATLAELRYEPEDAEPEAVADEASQPQPARDAEAEADVHVGERVRAREQQIARTVAQLTTQAELTSAIDGRPLTSAPATSSREDVANVVHAAFARSLSRPIDEIVAVDGLEALGCDSFRIVEITVGLVEHFPWLPSTLLFEHRSVREIVEHIERMADARARPAPAPALVERRERSTGSRDIAVVGIDLRCAGANSPDELWDLLARGSVALRPVPLRRRWFTRPLEDSRPHWAGLLDDLDGFDAAFFGISPREADLMDPQLRLFLQTAWGALEDANAVASGVDPETGVFVGVMYDDYAHHANQLTRGSGSPYKSWESFSLANRLSQVLGLRGPSLAVDTACSSSGTALHLACRAIADGDCGTAIVGGVNVILDPDRFAQLGRLGILSPTGRCLSFGKDADGTVLGEGVGVVVLRALDAAVARGDRIYGVIKGTGVSTGSGTVGFTAPNPQAQAVAIRRALDVSGVDPGTVSYVETHGTATLLGDPIEVRGLTLGYGVEEGRGPAHVRIGSIKPNIGHLEAGAAVLSLIKVLLQLQRRTLLPSVSSADLNPQIPFGHSPFAVQRTLEDWHQAGGAPRRAAVSSFGVGGANVHILVEEGPTPAPVTKSSVGAPTAHLVTLSTRSADALVSQAGALAAHLAATPGLSLGDVAHTLNQTRRPFEHRAAFVVSDIGALRDGLNGLASGTSAGAVARGTLAADAQPPRVAFLFTGQGAQFHGMGRTLYETQPVFREAIDECASHLDALLGVPLVTLLYEEEPEAERGRLDQTHFTQPALFAVEYALARLWQSWGVQPSAVIGHSVGEFAAMCIAGGLSVADGVRLIEARGRLMQALPAGGVMVSVAAPEARVRAALTGFEDRASIAGVNSPEQTVVSGGRSAVEQIVDALKRDGVRTRALTVSHAFHSPLMRPMVEAFREVVRSVSFTTPDIPIVSCVTGTIAGEAMLDPDYWVRQILEPVRFVDGMTSLAELGVTACLEVGPQPVLIGLGRRCLGERGTGMQWLPSLRKDADDWATLLGSAAQLYTSGASLDWAGVERPGMHDQVSLPRYAFDARPHWVQVPQGADVVASVPMRAADVAAYEVRWQRQDERPAAPPATPPGTWLLLDDRGEVAPALAAALEGRGARVVRVASGTAATAESVRGLLRADAPVAGLVHLRGMDVAAEGGDVASLDAWRSHALESAMAAVQASAGEASPVPVWCVTRGAVATGEDAAAEGERTAAALAQSTLWGFGRTASLEHPEAWGGLVDVPAGALTHDVGRQIADVLLGASHEDQVAIRADGAYVPRIVRREATHRPVISLSPEATYLVTGGMGALGLQVARWLVDHGARHLVLVGRQARGEAAIAQLRALGVSVDVALADVADAGAIDDVLSRISSGGHPLRGVVLAAGVDQTVPLERLTAVELAAVLASKVAGSWLLHDRTRRLDLDVFIGFSSLASVLGAAGRAHYAAANAFVDALAAERRRLGLPGLAVNWGPWAGEGMGADPQTTRQFEAIGNHPLDPADALHALDALVTNAPSQVVVADVEWDRFSAAYASRRPRPILAEVVRASAGGPAAGGSGTRAAGTADDIARQVREEVAGVLGFKRVDELPLDRGFFEMGLDSLSSVELVVRLRQRFGVDCQGFVFETPTVTALSERIVRAVAVGEQGATSPLPEGTAAASFESPAPVMYDPTWERAVLDFHRTAFGTLRRAELVEPRWRWMFLSSAERMGSGPRVWLYHIGDSVVGHMGSFPVSLWVNGEVLRADWLVETYVLPEYQSRAIGPRLLAAAQSGTSLPLSLGQSETMRDIQYRMGWKAVGRMRTAVLLVRPERVLRGKLLAPVAFGVGLALRARQAVTRLRRPRIDIELKPVERYTEAHTELWSRMAASVRCGVVRDASYLNWKYVDQPGQSFLRLDAFVDHALVGSTIWSIREPDSAYRYRRALLIDVLAPIETEAERRRLEAIVLAGCSAVADRGADMVLCPHLSEPLSGVLRRCGFSFREPGRFLLVHAERLPATAAAHVLEESGWHVTLGDSDIDRPW